MKIVEIGASDYHNCFCKESGFIGEHQFYLIEPNPILYNYLENSTRQLPNVRCFNYAVSNYRGITKFVNFGLNSWLFGAKSFMMGTVDLNGNLYNFEYWYRKLITLTEVCLLDDFGIKNIDYLSINCNGSELDILTTLSSLPKTIRTCYYMQTIPQITYYNSVTTYLRNLGYREVGGRTNSLRTYFEIEWLL